MRNKFLIFVVFVLVGLTVFLMGYLVSHKSDPIDQQALLNNSLVERFNKTEEKHVAPTGIFSLTIGEARFPYISPTGDILYYVPKNGEIRSVPISDPTAGTTLLAKIQLNADTLSWGSNKTLLASSPTASIFYDLTSNFSKKYSANIKNLALSKTGTKIAYASFDNETGGGNLTIADPRLESYKNVLATRFTDWQITWLGGTKLALIKPPTLENTTTSLYVLDLESGALHKVLDSKKNLDAIWSSNGQKIIYSYIDVASQENGLYFMDIATKTEVSLSSSLNASNCTWSIDAKTVYCVGKDSFVSFDTSVPDIGSKEVMRSSSATNAVDLTLNSTEDYLVFRNSQDGKLYGLRLAE